MTADYNGEQAAPPPVSGVIAGFLQRSFSIADVLRRGIQGWLFALIGLFAGLMFGLYSVWATPATYTVSVGLLPTDSNGDVYIGGATGSTLGALAGLLGMNGGTVPKFTRFVAALSSTSVAKIMDEKYDMLCRVYQSDCDIKTHTWRKHSGFDSWLRNTIASVAHLRDPDAPKTASDLADYTEANVVIASDRATHILTLSMDSRDPKLATAYLSALVGAANDYVKREDLSVVKPFVDYLNAKLGSSNLNLAQHEALSSLLLEQERRLMLSSVDVPYAASVQDGPNVSTSNAALRMLLVNTLVGTILGFALGVLRSFWARGRNRSRSKSW